ncbi:hypothetical protein LTR10_016842 [Elasticomyces elasticus]|uniref:Uncharacterized protein n=1 Tax=Exophiala sideris TaxID=1016849 RepID=A0ABR0JKB8_9EURO|nr:hypothetical protein LTR10_016842 [Elasticomyces elasticus]KAK5035388.1 hypothetical protein LTS07_002825 [Exophiala sideris]KAK5039261.1 hypothetical protein LTR13_003517 [Exophiala sideris]KAK5066312.1 hypothetical protein LTR69_002831 [Exophiala sideris]KAK5186989.1 hypothetical protein LTR44_000996 [Eurotiomycetes sp. CCFEE 6388]
MTSQQQDPDSQGSLAISPGLIVGIVIAASFATTIIVASVYGYCRKRQETSADAGIGENEAEIFNPNRVRTAGQTARLREVRWINNMYAWERGRYAKLEIGELRRATMLLGKQPGQNRSWDEWSSIEEQTSTRHILGRGTGDCTGAHLFYNIDDPYASSSRQRLSRQALPRYSSVLLPQPVQRSQIRNSRLRQEYQEQGDVEPRKQTANARFEPTALGPSQGRNGHIRSLTPEIQVFQPNEPYPQPPVLPPSPGSIIYSDHEGTTEQELTDTTTLQATDSNMSQVGVKSMIQEWEKMDGQFARTLEPDYLISVRKILRFEGGTAQLFHTTKPY